MFKKKRVEQPDKPLFDIAEGFLRELVATFLLVFAIGAFARLSEVHILSMQPQTLYIFYGLFFGAGIFIFNADMNPALTFARWIRGFIDFPELIARWVSQISAAFAAFYIVKLMGGTADMLMWEVSSDITAIDLLIIEGFFIAILMMVLFSNYKKTYKPLLFAVAFVVLQLLLNTNGVVIDSKLNLLFVLVPSVMFHNWSWHITMFAIAHFAAVSIMVIFWIKESRKN